MSAWILVLVFVHQEGVHSLQVSMGTQAMCEQAASSWRKEEQYNHRLRVIHAKCHATGAK
jgi:hypothetical protein